MKARYLIFLLVILPLVVVTAPAQSQDSVCPAFVTGALETVDTNCGGMDRNNACYGYNRVVATFYEETPDVNFSQPGDQTELTTLEHIETVPLNLDRDEWGVAALRLQANLPNTLPGQAVTMLIVGDAQVENAVSPDEAMPVQDAISVTARVEIVFYADPVERTTPVGIFPSGSELLADAVNPEGTRVRVLYQDQIAWVSRNELENTPEIDTLPVVDDSTRTPMQAFYFETGIGASECQEAPNSILIQGPEHYAIDITANGVNIRVTSTVLLRTRPTTADQGTAGLLDMEVASLSGSATVHPETPNAINIPAGQQLWAPLQPRPQTAPSPLGGEGFASGQMQLQSLPQTLDSEFGTVIQNAPASIMNYSFQLPALQLPPTPRPIPPQQPVSQPDADGDGVPDSQDQCPNQSGPASNGGCPLDRDGDGVPDDQDQCPDQSGPADNGGCPLPQQPVSQPDADGDGVPDSQDRCPNQSGPASNGGCPLPDRDGDGVTDNQDQCPDQSGPSSNGGCPLPDRDGDGVPDSVDQCPGQSGPASNNGCP